MTATLQRSGRRNVALREFDVELAPGTAIKVWDSSADLRYMVAPLRPVGTESWSEEQLAAIVTRDSMIGTGVAEVPAG